MAYGAGLAASGFGAGRGGFGAGMGGGAFGAGYGPATVAFNPLSVTGSVVWIEGDGTLWQDSARTTPVTADSDPVGAADDKSGNGRHAIQATGANRPLYKTAILNSLPVLRFDAVNDTLQSTIPADVSFTMFVVVKFPAADVKTAVSFAATAQLHKDSAQGAGVLWFQNQALGYQNLGGTPTNWNVIALRVNSAASMDYFINGGATANFDPQNAVTTATTLNLSTDGAGANALGGDIAMVILYDSALSNANLDYVGGGFATKYGLTWTPVS